MLKNITAALTQIETQGSFSTRQASPSDDLQIEIKDVGRLNFPLKPGLVKKVIKQARPAKFGWQDKTHIDNKVRDTWEIPKNKVKIDKRRWNKTLNPVLDQLKCDLGIPTQASLTAQLHNFLIYEPGQHFQPHQDSEKYPNMIATLVVILPSSHRGGTLIVNHKGDQKRYQSSSSSIDKLSFFAFYADCRHEVRPITEGYRVVLTYNLVLDIPRDNGLDRSINFVQQPLFHALEKYFTRDQLQSTPNTARKSPRVLVYLLDHEYTAKNLSWEKLKSVDKHRAQALKSAAKNLDLRIYLGLADIQEIWDCFVDNDYYGNYGGRYRHWDDEWDEEDKENDDNDSVELGDLISDDTSIRHWIDQNGKAVDFQALNIYSDSLCWTKATNDFKPFEEEYEGYMGNWGNTMDRWYHRAAIILWQKTDHYHVLLEIDPAKTIAEILQLAKIKSSHSKAVEIVRHLLPNWAERHHQFNAPAYFDIMKLALLIDDSELAAALLTPLDSDAICPKTTPILALLNTAYGPQWCISIMQIWFSTETRYFNKADSLVRRLPAIVKKLVSNTPSKNKRLSDWLLDHQLQAVTKNHLDQKNNSQFAQLQRLSPNRIKDITALLSASIITLNQKNYNHIIRFLIANPALYPVLELASIILHFHKDHQHAELSGWNQRKLFDYVFNTLTVEVNQPLRRPDDWSIRDKNVCLCSDCETLNHFLQSSDEKVKIWPLAKHRRQHIHKIIDAMELPVTHNTKRVGSPHKLQLRKTNKLFTQDRARDLKHKKTIAKLTEIMGHP